MSARVSLLQWVPASAAVLGLGALGAAALPQLVWAQEQAPQQLDTALFQALLADLQAGNRQAAINRISGVETLTGQPMLVSNRGQFVDRLLGCAGRLSNPQISRSGLSLIEAEWQCSGGTITARLATMANVRYITVVDMADQAERDRRAAQPVTTVAMAPPAPPAVNRTPAQVAAAEAQAQALAREQRTVLDAFASWVEAGSIDGLGDYLLPNARFSYGFRDPFNNVNVNDLQGRGLAAGQEAVAAATAALGYPMAHSCETGQFNVCRWTYAGNARGLLALVFFQGNKIANVQLIYITPEALAMAAQNATPEQVQAYVASQQAGGAN
jgi:hypothetical protein